MACSAIWLAVTGRCGDIEGVWIDPVGAQVMIALADLRIGVLLEAGLADVLDVEIFLEPVMRALLAESRHLDSAKRRVGGRDQASVDPDHPALEPSGRPLDCGRILRADIGGEPERRAVGK